MIYNGFCWASWPKNDGEKSKKLDKYRVLAIKHEILVRATSVETLGTISKKRINEVEIKGKMENIRTTALLKSGFLEEDWGTEENCRHSDSSEN